GFTDLLGFPGMLRHTLASNAAASYAISGIDVPGANVLALAVTSICLVLCWRQARNGDEAGAFVYALAASLAAAPMLWGFYLMILFVAIPTRRPEFHWLWAAPLVLWVFPPGVNPTDWHKAGVLLVAAAIFYVVASMKTQRDSRSRDDVGAHVGRGAELD